MAAKSNITQYLLENRASFDEVPFSEVDSLILSTVAYLYLEYGPLENASPGERVPLPVAICGIKQEELFGHLWLANMGGPEFLAALLQSPRFMTLTVSNYQHQFSEEDELQFAAMAFWLPGNVVYVAYRGTDNSIAGWQEDFNLSFMEEIPSQALARDYLELIASKKPAAIYTGGHSKGGNLCEYATLTCSVDTYLLVSRVFNHDGPAFAFPPSPRIESASYREKLCKTVPGSSIIGMIMERRSEHRIVKSAGPLILQHASTNWLVEDGAFVLMDELTPDAAGVDKALTEWTEINDPARRKVLVEALFQVIRAINAENWADMKEDPIGAAKAALKAVSGMSPEISIALAQLFMNLVLSVPKGFVAQNEQPHTTIEPVDK